MSSAALQAGLPTTVSALNTIPTSPSGRPYASTHSSPTAEGYHAQGNPAASPQSRPTRKNSGNGTNSNSSGAAPSQTNSPMSSRAAIASPVAVAGGNADYQSTSDRRRHVPPVAPPRTSSNRHDQTGAAPSSRRAAPAGERAVNSPRRAPQDAPERTGSRDAKAVELPIRSQGNATAAPPKGPSRETSEILKSVTITKEEVDIEREKARMAMAQPHHAGEAAPSPVVATSEHGEEKRRQSRSRHDHSKREKQIKFGEYILGNTIGEGEFGKVKLGWKPDGGVQVGTSLLGSS
jgi:protein-serine/threonine kinase